MCPRRELNPHGHCWPQDFKSCVSTSSTTRAGWILISNVECWNGKSEIRIVLSKKIPQLGELERKTGLEPATPTLARLCSTKWATSAWCVRTKADCALLSRLLSGELLPREHYKELKGSKNSEWVLLKKIMELLFILRSIQCVFRHSNIRFATISFFIQHVATAE